MARHFNGISDTAVSQGALQGTTPTAYTWALWAKGDGAPGTSSNSLLVAIGASGSAPVAAFLWDGTGGFDQSAQHIDGSLVAYHPRLTTALVGGTWYHLAAVWTGSALGVYLNGTQQATASPPSISWAAGIILAAVGSTPTGTGNWAGTAADVAAWNVALSGTEIVSLAAGRRANAVRGTSMMGYWPVLGLSPEPDYSGNANPLLVTGTTTVADPPSLDAWAPFMVGPPSSHTVPVLTVQQC